MHARTIERIAMGRRHEMSSDESARKKTELNPDEAKEVLKAIEEVEREEAERQASNSNSRD
jgi:hypothetical protein